MRLRFWGVRGSVPSPLAPARLRSKISSVVERIGPADIASQDARERFLAGLPEELFSTVGGNTPCVELCTDEPVRIIFDAGTGIRELGAEIVAAKRPADCHLFFSHFHWDHIQGLPFFAPAYDPDCSLHFYSPDPQFRSYLEGQMRAPYFPITMDAMPARKEFVVLGDEPLGVGGVEVRYRRVTHPGGCYSYRVEEKGLKVIYATDTELAEADFLKSADNAAFYAGADLLVIDTQYTLGEAIEKYNWGHSSFSLAADFAASWGIKRLVLFHHDPSYTDRKIHGNLKNAAWYLDHLETRGVEVILAREGLELEVERG